MSSPSKKSAPSKPVPIKAASPLKNKMVIPKVADIRRNNANKIVSCAFPGLPLEIHMLVMWNNKEGYTKNVVDVIAGNLDYDDQAWIPCNFVETKHCRIPHDVNNRRLLTEDGYPHRFFVAYPDGGSTKDTRIEAAEQLQLLLNKFNKYRVTDIIFKDITDQKPTLDKFFLDGDIKSLLELFVEKKHLTKKFKNEFPEFAAMIYSSESYPDGSYPTELGF